MAGIRPSASRPVRIVAALALGLLAAGPALAQGWSWPWEKQQSAPVPREPVYRGPTPPPGTTGPVGTPIVPGNRAPICLQLEQRLAQEANRGMQSRDVLPQIENDIRTLERNYQQAQNQLDRSECYEFFLFTKSLRRTRTCVGLANAADEARQKLADLTAQRQQILASSNRSYQDEIIRELARNNCGGTYQREAARQNPFSSIWQDEDSGAGGGGQFGSLPFATYRTICVRLCDGYFFPVSFSTLPTYFERDQEVCQSRCAAPVELYYHQNPGGAVEQAVSIKSQELYTGLKTAFRYRREFVAGCSCRQSEYLPNVADTGRGGTAPTEPASAPGPRAFSPKR